MSHNPANKRMASSDVILKLRPKDGSAKNVKGVVDNRLFNGENNLHIKMNPQTTLWTLEYDHGQLPLVFKQQFTGLQKAMTQVRMYYEKRGVEIVEVQD